IYIAPRKAWLTGAARTGSAMRASRPVRITATAFAWTLAAVSGAVPMAVLVWRSLPLRSYSEVFATAKTEIVTSILLAALTATIVTSLAFVLAYLNRLHHQTARRDIPPHPLQRGSWFVSSLLALRHASLLAFLASGPVLGTALILTWNRPGPPAWIYDTVLVVLLACSARYLFFAQYACENTLRDVDVQLDEAACVAGAPWWRVFSGILLPVSWPALAGVWGLAFILAMGEIDATALVCPPGVTPLSGRIFSLMHYGPSRLVAALSVTTVCIILACAAVTAGLYAKGKRVRDAQR
ncbi:MAG: iron(III) transport system permease protein, partial [Candidatus Hydrogenedentes bacterium]|nr:iron(III) transport system permease protein [Candidatus Hydrogenedentota bacterium]